MISSGGKSAVDGWNCSILLIPSHLILQGVERKHIHGNWSYFAGGGSTRRQDIRGWRRARKSNFG